MKGTALGFYFRLPKEDANQVRADLTALAERHGFTAVAGPTAGQGNPAELLVSIASGETALVLLPDEQRRWVCEWLHHQADQMESAAQSVREIGIAEAIRTIAEALG